MVIYITKLFCVLFSKVDITRLFLRTWTMCFQGRFGIPYVNFTWISYKMLGSDLEGKLENDFEFNNCVKGADIYIRMGNFVVFLLSGFVRKIYSILSVQLLLTCFTGAIMCTFKEPVSLFLSDRFVSCFLLWFYLSS